MECIEYRTFDKSGWGDGPWNNEPDKVQWQDEATGLPCLILRSPSGGNWCGYVGVPQGHPYHGKDYKDVDVDVHGSLTFSDGCSQGDEAVSICHKVEAGESDSVWWLGFDCHHYKDLAPLSRMRREARGIPQLDAAEEYRDLDFVTSECRLLAKQLAARG